MLNKLRNSSKNSFIKIVLGSLLTILILSFAMWGTEDLIGVANKQNTVASVGKIDVSAKEFYGLYTRQTEEIRKLLGASLEIFFSLFFCLPPFFYISLNNPFHTFIFVDF